MKILKNIFLSPFSYFFYTMVLFVLVMHYCHTTPKRYVGTIISVSKWDGSAKLKTKTASGKDTIVYVEHATRDEQFVVGQVITVWTGGELIGDFATTKPQH